MPEGLQEGDLISTHPRRLVLFGPPGRASPTLQVQSASWGPLSFSLPFSWQRSVHEVGSRIWGQPFNRGQLHQAPSLLPTPAFLGETIPLNVRAPDFQKKQSSESE